MTPDTIRQQFLDFFRSKQHTLVPSSPVVPHDDPTLMFANAGMNQFKPIFLGQQAPDVDKWPGVTPSLPTRAANSQKCIRAGGKHNDLDDVGQDTYHHTFFEMLGNWSFGDYFKKDAIAWAWELLTKVWGIDKTRLHATYFEGDADEGLEPDSEAAELWRTVTDIDPSHIHPGNKKDNFWEMGDTGPCGPCSEIHIDLTPDKSGGPLVNAGDARVIEIWNLVFIQFNRGSDRKLSPLPAKHVDTGMGFERLCAVLEGMAAGRLGKTTNYDTGVFTPIFEAIQKRTGAPKYTGTLPGQSKAGAAGGAEPGDGGATTDQEMIDVSYRVIADHIRCLTFALTDGAMPSNEGRGYVLRRILRRAVRYGRQYMNMHEPFLSDLVKPVIDHMSGAFPELKSGPNPKQPRDNAAHVAGTIRDEEESFGRTFDRGLKLYRDEADYARTHHHGRISGEAAFKLHDTYGFTIDLTELMAEEDGLTINLGEYNRLMEEAREKARDSGKESGYPFGTGTYKPLGSGSCDDSAKYLPPFECNALIWSVRQVDGLDDVRPAAAGARVVFWSNHTSFYAEQGGQVSDTGVLECSDGTLVDVTGVVRSGDYIEHRGIVRNGNLSMGAKGVFRVDRPRRTRIMQNHTATHLLNWALRDQLGAHIDQKGSLVDPEKTRFDFSHNKPVSDEELQKIENLVKSQIDAEYKVYAREVDQQAARKINTLRAVFGEKYPDRVRVVSIGVPIGKPQPPASPGDADGARGAGGAGGRDGVEVGEERMASEGGAAALELEDEIGPDTLLGAPDDDRWMQYSVEFCGGTHVANTREIGDFVLTQEEGVAKGIRRLVGISGDAAAAARKRGEALVAKAGALLRDPHTGGESPPSEPRASARAESPAQHRLQTGATLQSAIADIQAELSDAVIPLADRRRVLEIVAELQEQLKQQQKAAAAESGGAVMDRMAELFAKAETIGGVTVVVGGVPPANADALRGAIDWVRNKTKASAVMLACHSDGKVTLIAGMSKDVVARGIKAGDLIKEVAPLVGGKGGGRPDMAQGGGTDATGIPQALARAGAWIREKCG